MAKDEKTRDTVLLFTSIKEPINAMSDEDAGKLFKAVLAYQTREEVRLDGLLNVIFLQIKQQVDYANERYAELSKKRSEARKKKLEEKQNETNDNKTEQKTTKANKTKQTTTNRSYNDNKNDNDNVNDNKNDNEININVNHSESIAPAPESHRYGVYNNVVLKDDERDALMNAYPDSYQEKIDNLSMYMKSKGAVYRDHYATIMKWAREDAGKDVQKASPSRYPPKQGSAEDLANFSNMLKEMAEERRKGDKK